MPAIQILKRHPISLIFYGIYLFLFYRLYVVTNWLENNMKLHPERSGIANGGEVAGITGAFLTLYGFIFFLVSFLLAIRHIKDDSNFYWWLCFAIFFPIIILGSID